MNKTLIIIWVVTFVICLAIFTIVKLEISNRQLDHDNQITSNRITALEKENTVLHNNIKHYIAKSTGQTFKITYYHANCHEGNCNTSAKTASGTVPVPYWTVAVDPAVIPLGSYIFVEGKMYLAVDSGVRGNVIDICVTFHQEALDLGRHYTDNVYILTEVQE